jgi:lipopolysaccharide/colanic/teichoic acid biosynthesis glycosyltransferase
MTGWAQVHGLTGDTSISDRARFDNYYIDHWSVWLDVVILIRTLVSPFAGLRRQRVAARQRAADAGAAAGAEAEPGL